MRLWRVSGTSVTEFLYDGDALVREYSGTTILRSYVHGPGVDEPVSWYEGTNLANNKHRALLADHQGSIIAVTDQNGASLSVNAYGAYGEPGAANLGRFTFTGQIIIPELGLYYYKARIYNPDLGRFMQTDPIGYEDNINLYAYVGNDPFNLVDPRGEESAFALREHRRNQQLLSGDISVQEFRDQQNAEGVGAVVGLAVLATRGAVIRLAPAFSRNFVRNNSLTRSQQRGIRSLQSRIKEHKGKIGGLYPSHR